MSLFERLRDGTGLTLLTKYGDVFRITKNNNGTFVASTGVYSVSTATQNVRGKMFSLSKEFESFENVQSAESEVYITASGLTFPPQPGMLINEAVSGSAPYTITKVRKIPESGIAVIYRLIVKQ